MNGVLESLSCSEKCCICGDVADGYHYGALSCRGCNAFFRRAVTCKLNFTCRRGGHCPVDKDVRCSCRACRLKKCEEMGMDRRAVQPKPEVYVRRKMLSESSACSTSCTESTKSTGQQSPYDQFSSSPKFSALLCSSNDLSPVFEPSLTLQTHLIILADDYSFQRQKRYMLLCSTVGEILAAEQAVLREPATGRDYSLIFEVQMNLMFQWVNSLPEYKAIDDNDDKVKLLRAFAFRYLLLDNIFHSVELNVRDRIVLVNNSYIIPGQIPAFYPGEDPNARMVKLMMYGDSSFCLLEDIIKPMIDMQIGEVEMMALRLFIFWNPSVNNLSSSTNIIVQTAADNAMGELHQWYSNNGILNVEERVSSILLLLPVLIKHAQELNKIVKMIPLVSAENLHDPAIAFIVYP